MYSVLWFDDEHNELEAIKDQALDYDIKLVGVTNAQDGLALLKSDQMQYDAILLDGKFFVKSNQVGDSLTDNAFGEVANYINLLREKGIYKPWFIYSGQPSFVKENNVLVEVLGQGAEENGRVFDKNKDEDAEELFLKMVEAIKNSVVNQIKVKYKNVFAACAENILGKAEESRLVSIISTLESNDPLQNTDSLFTPLRKVLEKIMDRLRELSIIPKEITQLNTASLFLSGRHQDYVYRDELIHTVIAHTLFQVLQVVQDAAHNTENLRLKVDEYLQSIQSPFLYRASAFQVLELVVWFGQFIHDNSAIELNKTKWKSKISEEGWLCGKVTRIADNHWGTFQPDSAHVTLSIPPKMVIDNELIENEAIKIITEPSPDGKKTFIKEIRRSL